MMQFKDMLGTEILLKDYPKRIVSLVPSQTELLYDLGLEEEVVGITKFCIHPKEWFETKKRIGGPKKLNIDTIQALKPDLIIANKEENIKEEIEKLRKIAPVWISDINNLEESLVMITEIGSICGKEQKASEIHDQIKNDFSKLPLSSIQGKTVAYFIWYQPLMVVASNTYIDDILNRIGFINIFKGKSRYPETNWTELKALNPEIILLSSEPFPFSKKHQIEFENQLPNTKIVLVDGEPFTWYGSRMLYALSYFKNIF
ncbi:MAG TPA: helical backbone metal receptor [Edaphocola sp.]|nr:helical backbone metal receptor [Edaphocola sp.]